MMSSVSKETTFNSDSGDDLINLSHRSNQILPKIKGGIMAKSPDVMGHTVGAGGMSSVVKGTKKKKSSFHSIPPEFRATMKHNLSN